MPNLIPAGVSASELASAHDRAKRSEPEVVEWKGLVLRTDLINKGKTDVVIWSKDGRPLFTLAPKGECFVESWDRETLQAPYSKIVYEKNGRVSVTKRHGWPEPELRPGALILELVNLDSSGFQTVYVDREPVTVFQGFPKRVACPLDDPLIRFRKIVWKLVTKQVPAANPDYVIVKTVLDRVMTERPAREIKKIRALIAEIEEKKAHELAEMKCKGLGVGGPEPDESETDDGNEMPVSE
jgi:hypothetical protein